MISTRTVLIYKCISKRLFHQLTNVRLFTRSMTDKDDPEVLFLLKRRETETDPNKQTKKKKRKEELQKTFLFIRLTKGRLFTGTQPEEKSQSAGLAHFYEHDLDENFSYKHEKQTTQNRKWKRKRKPRECPLTSERASPCIEEDKQRLRECQRREVFLLF